MMELILYCLVGKTYNRQAWIGKWIKIYFFYGNSKIMQCKLALRLTSPILNYLMPLIENRIHGRTDVLFTRLLGQPRMAPVQSWGLHSRLRTRPLSNPRGVLTPPTRRDGLQEGGLADTAERCPGGSETWPTATIDEIGAWVNARVQRYIHARELSAMYACIHRKMAVSCSKACTNTILIITCCFLVFFFFLIFNELIPLVWIRTSNCLRYIDNFDLILLCCMHFFVSS